MPGVGIVLAGPGRVREGVDGLLIREVREQLHRELAGPGQVREGVDGLLIREVREQ